MQATHELVSHKFLMSESDSVEHRAFAALLHYCVNSVGKKVFVPLILGQDWKSAAGIGGDVCKRFLGSEIYWAGDSVPVESESYPAGNT